MADDQKVEVELKAKDSASAVVRNISKATGKLLSSVDKITKGFGGIMSRYGGIGAALSLGTSVNSAKKYFDQIARIKNVAGGTAHEIASVSHMMKGAGVSASDMERTYVMLAKKGGEMKAHMKGTTKLARQLGVNFKTGPVDAMLQLSKRLKAGKIGYKELNKLGGESMLRMRKFLMQGPKAIERQFAEASKKMGHVNDSTMMQYAEFKKGVGKISQAWNRMVVIVGAKLLPILTKLMDGVSSRIDNWADGAAKFGDFLVTHMNAVVAAAKVFGKIMMANYVLMKLTGKGLSGNMATMVAGARKRHAGAAALTVANQVGMPGLRGRMATGIGGMMGRGGKTGKVGGLLMKFFNGITLLSPIIKLLLKLTVVGVVIAAVVYGIKAAVKNMEGIGTKIKKLFGGIWDDVKQIRDGLAEAFGPDSPLGKIVAWIGKYFVDQFVRVLQVVKAITGFVATVIYMLENRVGWDEAKARIRQKRFEEAGGGKGGAKLIATTQKMFELTEKTGKLTANNLAFAKNVVKNQEAVNKYRGDKLDRESEGYKRLQALKQRIAISDHVPGERPTFYQDFRGSRFDITQKFAEGFDPDRIAIAFANDLSNFGDQAVQSNLAPWAAQ